MYTFLLTRYNIKKLWCNLGHHRSSGWEPYKNEKGGVGGGMGTKHLIMLGKRTAKNQQWNCELEVLLFKSYLAKKSLSSFLFLLWFDFPPACGKLKSILENFSSVKIWCCSSFVASTSRYTCTSKIIMDKKEWLKFKRIFSVNIITHILISQTSLSILFISLYTN